jgi:hypothetical protein
MKTFFSFLLALIFLSGATFAQDSAPFNNFPKTSAGQLMAWIFFKDKGPDNEALLAKPQQFLSRRALERRRVRRPGSPLVEYSDLPVFAGYIDLIKPFVQKIRVKSRWLNAVSVEANASNLRHIAQLSCVLKIDPVALGHAPLPPETRPVPTSRLKKAKAVNDSLPYGVSAKQLDLIRVPFLHQKGFYGKNVLICMLDDGVNLLGGHEALRRVKILATHDFIHGDDLINDTGIKAYEGWHGTMTLSVIAGYAPDVLIGPAFEATFILAKTEIDQYERPIEEDYWVAGIEWGDSLGADIVSSSLGYIDWYTPADMDGETAKTTIAADMAAEKGILVFNSAGNEGDNPEHNTLIAPADGKKVLAVAATDRYGIRASFSSVGPSADGRIKPDIAAMGASVIVADSKDSSGYRYSSGTSFSCPLAAGGTALLLQAFPTAPAQLVIKALKSTASQANFPDKYLGWGVIDLEKAYQYLDTAVVRPSPHLSELEFLPVRNNPGNRYVEFAYRVKYPSAAELRIYDMLGRRIHFPSLRVHLLEAEQLYVERINTSHLAGGTYVARLAIRELGTGRIIRKSQKFVVLH